MAETVEAEGQTSVRVTNLACLRGDRLLFEELSFDVSPGGLLIASGPNGAGKSSLLRVLAGLLPASAGTVQTRTRIAYLGHRNALKERLTVRENLVFWSRFTDDVVDVDGTLKQVNLERIANAPAEWLSAGQRRRLGLARILATNADLWLLDEPEANLDTEGVALVRSSIAIHRTQGGIAVVASPAAMEADEAQRIELGKT